MRHALTKGTGGHWLPAAPATGRLTGVGRVADLAGAALAIVMLAGTAGAMIAEKREVDRESAAVPGSPGGPGVAETAGAETLIAGYLGATYTYPSDIHIVNPAEKTDLTVHHAGWDGKPFKHPIYYGVRIARWAPGNRTGYMVDFTHAKTITRPDEEVEIKGLINGATVPGKAKIGELFKHMEFSHGHNMLTINGLLRLANLTPRLSPYLGLGAGVALPHTEVQLANEPQRTYEYQYAGPVGQGLAGIEVPLAGRSLFFEYKFSFAGMRVPLSRMDTSNLFSDVYRQLTLWWTRVTPPGGELSAGLLTHHVIGGAGVRVASP